MKNKKLTIESGGRKNSFELKHGASLNEWLDVFRSVLLIDGFSIDTVQDTFVNLEYEQKYTEGEIEGIVTEAVQDRQNEIEELILELMRKYDQVYMQKVEVLEELEGNMRELKN